MIGISSHGYKCLVKYMDGNNYPGLARTHVNWFIHLAEEMLIIVALISYEITNLHL